MKWVLGRLLEYGGQSVRFMGLTGLQLGRFLVLQPSLMTTYAAELRQLLVFGVSPTLMM